MINERLKEDKKVLGSIRNPFDWYVSHYHYQKKGNGLLYSKLLNRSKDFETYLIPLTILIIKNIIMTN